MEKNDRNPANDAEKIEESSSSQEQGILDAERDLVSGPVLKNEIDNSITAKVSKVSDKTWNIIQLIIGLILGVGAAYSLFFWKSDEELQGGGFLTAELIIAIGLVLIVPRLIERWFERDMHKGRLVIIATILIGLVVRLIIPLIAG